MVTDVSVLIPIYNQDVTALVHTLLAQCKRFDIAFEIRLYDDASEEDIQRLNRPLALQPGVVYHELPHNIGRAAIRNKLALEASHSYILMLDNDCLPVSSNFIYDYLAAGANADAVVGGIAYVTDKPERPYRLHWKYGKQRGSRCAAKRQLQPYENLFLCNALVRRDLFLRFPLREKLTRYGHEDTVFAQEMRKNGARVLHIDNPVVHLGLEKASIMLDKTHQAVGNLVQLYQDGEELENIRLIRTYERLSEMRLIRAYTFAFSGLAGIIEVSLASAYPNLLLFDLYRLYLFSKKLKPAPRVSIGS